MAQLRSGTWFVPLEGLVRRTEHPAVGAPTLKLMPGSIRDACASEFDRWYQSDGDTGIGAE